MSWEQRLRDLVLAGGALAATACGGSTSAQADASVTTTPNETSTSGDDGSSNDAAFVGSGCCNANSDPCCYLGCSPATAASQPECEQNRTQCESMNGFYYETQPDGSLGCSPLHTGNTDACAPSGCTGSCLDLNAHNVSSVVNGCTVWRCCVPDDAGPEAATDAAADASAGDAADAAGE